MIRPQQLWREAQRRGLPDDALLLVVDVARQALDVWTGTRSMATYAVSTAAAGLGEQSGSGCTPRGFHAICERIGHGAPLGQVFRDRIPVDTTPTDADDLIQTRILRLDGLEEGFNRDGDVDSHARTIYLHGTNHETALGTPVSHGCIRLANADIAELFELVADRPTWCWIGEMETKTTDFH